MFGCKFCKMDKQNNERCVLTGELTNGAVLCDFEFEEHCDLYKEAMKTIRRQRSERPAKAQLVQTSIFGAAGEKPFKV